MAKKFKILKKIPQIKKKKGNPFKKKSEKCYQILTPNYPAKSSSWYAIFKNRLLEGDFGFDEVGSPTSPKY